MSSLDDPKMTPAQTITDPPDSSDPAFPMSPRDKDVEEAVPHVKGMDKMNAKAVEVLKTEGSKAAVNHMFTRSDGSTRTYSEMRSLYG